MRRFAALLLALALTVLSSAPARAERRVALVIGNAAYPSAPLRNPVNDARDMAAALRSLGFEVIQRENASLRQMEDGLEEFWRSLKRGGTGLFFFAGHGIQVKGVNYLVPVDARISVEQDARSLCLDAGRVLGRMENAGNGLNIVLLDACRNNPFARAWRSTDAGLAKMDAPTGTLIGYATAPDSVAADGTGRNGVYTSNLLRFMRTPGLKVEDVLKQVRIGVLKDTGNKQTPWESSSLTGDFYFNRAGAQGHAPGTTAQPEAKQMAMAPAPQRPPAQATQKPGDSWTDPVTGMTFLWVPGGEFEMGCGAWAESCSIHGFETPPHTVRLDGFWLGRFEVTQGQWRKVAGTSPSRFQKGGDYPVERVSWDEAREFVNRLNAMGAAKFRLPSEAEWEYAARSGGRQEEYAGGEDADRVAWHENNSGGATHPVGAKAPNALGFHDMSGNVAEWTEDVFRYYTAKPLENPVFRKGAQAWKAGGDTPARIARGGAWLSRPGGVATYYRAPYSPEASDTVGLRLVRAAD